MILIQFFRMFLICFIILPFSLQIPYALDYTRSPALIQSSISIKTSVNQQQQQQQQQCNCINVKNCKLIMDSMIDEKQKFSSDLLISYLRKNTCGFNDRDPLICCPKTLNDFYDLTTQTIVSTTEIPWIWDIEKSSKKSSKSLVHRTDLNDQNDDITKLLLSTPTTITTASLPSSLLPSSSSSSSTSPSTISTTIITITKSAAGQHNLSSDSKKILTQNRFNDFDDYHLNLIDFEDPKTLKNCPPNFFDDDYHHNMFHIPSSSSSSSSSPLPSPRTIHKNGNNNNKDKNLWGSWKFYPQPPFAEFPINKHRQQHHHFSHEYDEFPFESHGDKRQQKPPPQSRPSPPKSRPTLINVNNTQTDRPSFKRKNTHLNNKRKLINSLRCGISVGTRIIGGIDAGPQQFPWMARLAYKNRTSGRISYRCAGSVINDRYVVTAAHCVTNLIESLEIYVVRLGELDAKRDLDCNNDPLRCNTPQDYEIDKLIPHQKYDTPKYANDIALIRLLRIPNTAQVTPICLPFGEYSKADNNLTGKTAIVAGWGVSSIVKDRRTITLQWVRLPIVNRSQCAITYAEFSANSRTPIIISSSQICVQGKENMDACQGDSGGPLMDEGNSNSKRYTLLGLVSFGPRTCGVSNFPGVYTRISSYINWILNTIEP